MNKLLKFQILLLVALVAATVFIRIGILENTPESTDPQQNLQQDPVHTDPSGSQPGQTEQTDPSAPATDPATEPTEKELVLTFGEDFELQSRDYFIYDCTNDKILTVVGGLDDKLYPASITKIFTAYVALQYLEPEQVVTLGREVNLVASNSSLAYVKVGQTISVAELVEGMLLPSGNDAAYGLAVAAARTKSGDADMEISDALEYFVDLMNETAQDLGMTGTHFVNPDGIHDADHYTSSRDMMTMAKLALDNECIRECVMIVSDQVAFSNGEVASWSNTNELIDPESQYYCSDAVGLKTGHTSAAGFCLLSAFEVDGNYYVVGTLGCQRPEDRFIDALKLYNVLIAAIEG